MIQTNQIEKYMQRCTASFLPFYLAVQSARSVILQFWKVDRSNNAQLNLLRPDNHQIALRVLQLWLREASVWYHPFGLSGMTLNMVLNSRSAVKTQTNLSCFVFWVLTAGLRGSPSYANPSLITGFSISGYSRAETLTVSTSVASAGVKHTCVIELGGIHLWISAW